MSTQGRARRGDLAEPAMRRFTVAVAVYGLLFDADRVLLLRRAGSGHHDGEPAFPPATSTAAKTSLPGSSANCARS